MAEPIKFPGEAMASPEGFHAVWETRLQTAREAVARAKEHGFPAQIDAALETLKKVEAEYNELMNGGGTTKAESTEIVQ